MTKEQWILYKALVAVENPNIEIAEGEQGLLDICNDLVSRGLLQANADRLFEITCEGIQYFERSINGLTC